MYTISIASRFIAMSFNHETSAAARQRGTWPAPPSRPQIHLHVVVQTAACHHHSKTTTSNGQTHTPHDMKINNNRHIVHNSAQQHTTCARYDLGCVQDARRYQDMETALCDAVREQFTPLLG
jgi:hypothetical protein